MAHIRPAIPEDLDALTLLLEQLFAIEADFDFDAARQQRGLAMLIASPQAAILVAETNGTVAGMCTGQIIISTAEGGPALLVEDVIVDQKRRGGGIGPKLLAALADWAKEQGANRLQLLADRNNMEGLDFYKKQGWQRTDLICMRLRCC